MSTAKRSQVLLGPCQMSAVLSLCWHRTRATQSGSVLSEPIIMMANAGGHSNCVPEEDGSVLVRDDLDALLQVGVSG